MPQGTALGLALAVVAVLAAGTACTQVPEEAGTAAPASESRREVLVDRGSTDVVDLRPAKVQAAPGDVVILRSGNPGRGPGDESPVHHLFTTAPQDALPPLFVPAGQGVLPNPGVWGLCRGGDAANAGTGCPIPPIDGPREYDGHSYFSLGALLPGEQRELPLSKDLPAGNYRLTCAVHPHLHVDVEVVREPASAELRPAMDAAQAGAQAADLAARHAAHTDGGEAVVLLAPQPGQPAGEVLQAVPAQVQIPVGGTVLWRNANRAPHTVELGIPEPPHLTHTGPADTVPTVPADGRWNGDGQVRSGVLSTDSGVGRTEFRLTFTKPGLYVAYDRFSPTVTTQVRVG